MVNKTLQLLYTDVRLLDLLEVLDQLHSAASEGYLESLTRLGEPELLDVLREVMYTAQETIAEIEQNNSMQQADEPALRVLPKAAGNQ
jgi:hypothetical protein